MPILNRLLTEKANCVIEILNSVNPKYKNIKKNAKWISNRIVKHLNDDDYFETLIYLGDYNYLGFYSIYYKEQLDKALSEDDTDKVARLIMSPLTYETSILGDKKKDILMCEKMALNLYLERKSLSLDDKVTLKECRKEVYKIEEDMSSYLYFPTREKIFVDGNTVIKDIRDFIFTAANNQMKTKMRDKVKQIHMDELKMMMVYKKKKEESEGVLWSSTPEAEE